MIIYNPHNVDLLTQRIKNAEQLFTQIPVRHCFISGSYIYKEHYKDIDVFMITRSKKEITLKNVTKIDFNDLSSLFYHSISKSCIAKNFLPHKSLKVTLSDYWQVINEAIPTLLNDKNKFHKNIRFLVLYTEYFKTKEVLDTIQLHKKIESFTHYTQIIEYIKNELPEITSRHAKTSYLKRFFYTQAGYYKKSHEYPSQKILYELAHQALTLHD